MNGTSAQKVKLVSADNTDITESETAWLNDPCAVSGISIGSVNYCTIQDAISAAIDGDTISIQSGTYTEAGQIVINKNISIKGSDKNTVVIKPAQGTGSGNHQDSSAWILVSSGVTFNLSDVTLDGTGQSINHAILSHGHGTITNNNIRNIVLNKYAGIGIELYGSDMTISNNSFSNIGRIGVYTGFGSVSTITGNTYTGKGMGDFLDYAFEVGRNGKAIISGNNVTNNVGVASTDGSTSAGILVTSYFNPATPSQASITGNTISNSTFGVAIGYADNDETIITNFSANVFANNDFDLDNHTINNIDARSNTWSVNDNSSLNEIESKINHNCNGSTYTHGVCDESDYDTDFGVVRYWDLSTPINLGWNVPSRSSTPDESPVDLSCASPVYTNENTVSQNWSLVQGVNIKYRREVIWPNGTIAYFDAGSTNYTPFSTFGSSAGTEGAWKVRVMAYVDSNNNNVADGSEETSSWSNQCTINLDRTVPSTPTLTAPPDGSYNSGNPVQSWTAVAGAHHYRYQSSSSPDFSSLIYSQEVTLAQRTVGGNQTISFYWRVMAVDAAGNESGWSTPWKLNIDNSDPVVDLLTPITSIIKGAVDIRGSVQDANPYRYYAVVTDASNNIVAGPGTVYDSNSFVDRLLFTWNTLGVSDGVYKIQLAARDRAQNRGAISEENITVTVDNHGPLAPIITSPIEGGAYKTQPILNQWTIPEDISGIKQYDVEYIYADGRQVNRTTTLNYRNHVPALFEQGGVKYRVRAIDNANNVGVWSEWRSYVYDATKPVSTINLPENLGNGSTVTTNEWDGSISGAASDSHTSVSRVDLSIRRASDGFYWNGTAWVNGSESTTRFTANGTTVWDYTVSSPLEDSYTIASHAVDVAGNVENSYTLTIVLDKSIQEVSVSINPAIPDAQNDWYKTQPEITLIALDNDIDRIDYQWDATTDGGWITYSSPFKLGSEGGHILYYRAHDLADNYTEVGVKNIKWDSANLTEGPLDISVSPNPTNSDKSTVTWKAAKDSVGINKYEIQWKLGDLTHTDTVGSDVFAHEIDELTEGKWTVIVRAFDHAGNSKESSLTLIVDRTAPSAPALTLSGTTAGTASLNWSSVVGASSYTLWYGTESGNYLYGANVGNVTNYTVQGLSAGTYFFIVRASDSAGNGSSNSNEVTTGTITGAPGVQAGAVAEGFVPAGEVQGVQTEDEQTNPDVSGDAGNVLGARDSQLKNLLSQWWFYLLLILLIIFGYYLAKRRK
jgi:hypothetical protein